MYRYVLKGRKERRKVEVKSLCLPKYHAMKKSCGNGGIVPYILNLGTSCPGRERRERNKRRK
jgi:hypothetical protein